MEFRAPDEFEEVESPFARPAATAPRKTQRLRNKKNVFNRPFAAEASAPPAYVDVLPKSSRKSVAYAGQAELLQYRDSELDEAPIDYLKPKTPKRISRPKTNVKKSTKNKTTILTRVGWGVVGLMVLRLVLMDRGVYDYYSTQNLIETKNQELQSLTRENEELKMEISRIHVDANYQRLLAKEHLGVIAADEFLILFAQDHSDGEIINPDLL